MSKNDYHGLDTYMASISRYSVLTKKDELAIARRYKAGDQAAREILINSNLRFVVKVAHEYSNYCKRSGINLIDIVQEGNMGLMKAVEKFDPERGGRVVAYARFWIMAYVNKYVMSNYHTVKIATTNKEKVLFYKTAKILELMEIKDVDERAKAREKLARKISKKISISVADVIKYEKRVYDIDMSIDKTLIGYDDSTWHDIYSDKSPIQDEIAIINDMCQKVHSTLAVEDTDISEKELEIIKQRFLPNDGIVSSLNKVGEAYGVSREWIRQLESRALKKLFTRFCDNGLDAEALGL